MRAAWVSAWGVVAEMFPGRGVHFLGVQAQRAGSVQQFGEQVEGLAPAAFERQRFNQPEGTGQERALGARQPSRPGGYR